MGLARTTPPSFALLAAILVGIVSPHALAQVQRFASGLPHRVERLRAEAPITGNEETVVAAFLRDEFPAVAPAFRWQLVQRIVDATHVHRRYALYFGDRRVVSHFLHLDYNRDGWVQYATSSFRTPFSVDFSAGREAIAARAVARWGAQAPVRAEPVVWVPRDGGPAREAVDVTVARPGAIVARRFLADPRTGAVLGEFRNARFFDNTQGVYPSSPLDGGLSSVTIATDDEDKLTSSAVTVQRSLNPNFSLISVDPRTNYSTDPGFETNPCNYGGIVCTDPLGTGCPNQAFDAVNVFYLLTTYRTWLDGLITQLGVTTSPIPTTALPVVVNHPTLPYNGSNLDRNNAAYVPSCTTTAGFDKCLVLLRPDAILVGQSCDPGTTAVFHLSREAIVVRHEFQHYITDAITHINFDFSSETYVVGDALHEGYSDFFAVAGTDEIASVTQTKVLAYAYQNFTTAQRDVGVLRVFGNGSEDADPHLSGLTWASALWQLRTELGGTAGNLLALKSQFFMPSSPGYVDAVEALVRADVALNAGAHVTRIRELLYRDLKFLGGRDSVFTNLDPLFVSEVGFRSCSAAGAPMGPAGALATVGIFAAWLGALVVVGRRRWRRS